ncbi:MAG: GNAT family N-acetyltransferase [Chloroflexi bacterium]|nr:GNAT family N-acetyltransferase [Chloroflexota bacterium]
MPIHLRAIRAEDAEFLLAVYSSTRADEMRLVNWDEAQKEAFLRMQFNAQTRYYTDNYPGAEFQIIQLGEQPIGRLYIHRRKNELRIMDISLLPEYRGNGIGSSLLNRIMAEAAENALPVTIHVERFNSALRLYERLGFCMAEERGVYFLMKWTPAPELEEYDFAG